MQDIDSELAYTKTEEARFLQSSTTVKERSMREESKSLYLNVKILVNYEIDQSNSKCPPMYLKYRVVCFKKRVREIRF